MREQLAFDFSEPQPRRDLKEFKRRWFADCDWCSAKDVPIFCHVGTAAVCSDCFTTAVERRNA